MCGIAGKISQNPFQAHIVADIPQFANRDVLETFAPFVEMLVDFHGRLLHDRMRLLTSPTEEEVLPSCNPGVAVFVVERQAQQGGRLGSFVGGFHHGLIPQLMQKLGPGKSSPAF